MPVRARRDGWTPGRQAAFLGYLAETRCVKRAARKVGMSRESAYRLRRKAGAEGFCAAWDAIMGDAETGRGTSRRPARKVTPAMRAHRIAHGMLRPVLRGGRYIGTERKAHNSALRGALAHADRVLDSTHRRAARAEGHTPQKGASVSTDPPSGPPVLRSTALSDPVDL
ncbi:MAG: hypothetical protein ACTS1Z_00340 [Parasphingopyxis sp.]